MEPIPPSAASEFTTLHRQVRWLTAVCCFLGLGLVLELSYHFLPAQPELAAGRFVLMDTHGRVRAELAQWGDDTPVLQLNGRDGQPRLVLVASDDGSTGLRILDSTHVHRVFLQTGRDGWPELLLCGPDGNERLRLLTGASGVGRIERSDASGKPIVER